MKRPGLLLLALLSALVAGCDSSSDPCMGFFTAADSLLTGIPAPGDGLSGAAAVAWAEDTATRYRQISEEAGRSYDRARDNDVRSALLEEQKAATEVAVRLDELAAAAKASDASGLEKIVSALRSAARAERSAAAQLVRRCEE